MDDLKNVRDAMLQKADGNGADKQKRKSGEQVGDSCT